MTVYAHRHDCKNDAPEEMCLGCISARYEELEAEIERLREKVKDYESVLNRIAPHDIQGWVHSVLSRHRKGDE